MNFESELPIAECVFQEGDCLILSHLNKVSKEHLDYFNSKNSYIRILDFYGVEFLKDEVIDISVFKNLKELRFTNCFNLESVINNSSSDTLKFLYIKSFRFLLKTYKEYPQESFNVNIKTLDRFPKLTVLEIDRYNKVIFNSKPLNYVDIKTSNVTLLDGPPDYYTYEQLRAEKELRQSERDINKTGEFLKRCDYGSPRTLNIKLVEPDF